MKTWIKRTLIGVTALGVVLGGAAVAWSHSHGGYGHGYGWRQVSDGETAEMKAKVIERVGSRLNLDANQKAKLGIVADRLREQRNTFIGDSADPRTELKALIAGPTFDRQRALNFVQGRTAAVQTGSPALIAALGDFYDSLRPEQQAQVREFVERARRGERRRD